MDEMIYPDVFKTSDEVDKITTALLAFNKSAGVIKKGSKNPFFKSDYADLPSIMIGIKPHMEKANLTINHFPVGDNRLVTRLSHSSGQFFQGLFYMKSVKDTPQDRGSVITYMMRYAVGAYLGLSIDKDDDGNKGSHAPKQPTVKSLTDPIKDVMLSYIADGNVATVKKQLSNYGSNANKTIIIKALADFDSITDLECDATAIDAKV